MENPANVNVALARQQMKPARRRPHSPRHPPLLSLNHQVQHPTSS